MTAPRTIVHEVTSRQSFSGLRARAIGVRRPRQAVATADDSVPTSPTPVSGAPRLGP